MKNENNDESNTPYEEDIHKQIEKELGKNKKVEDLWERALNESNGDEEIAKGLYIQYRAKLIMREREITRELHDRALNIAKNRNKNEPVWESEALSFMKPPLTERVLRSIIRFFGKLKDM